MGNPGVSSPRKDQSKTLARSAPRRRWVIGNWKMNGDVQMAEHLFACLRDSIPAHVLGQVQVGLCPPFPYLGLAAARLTGSGFCWGAQDVSAYDNGAFTGEVSAAMLSDVGCRLTLIGHSERRTLFHESDDEVARKLERALAVGLLPVVCVGETLEARESGRTEAVLAAQIEALSEVLWRVKPGAQQLLIAYEPVWAIGTGRSATPDQAQAAHRFIRSRLGPAGLEGEAEAISLLYGGSVKPGNACELFAQPDIDGGLIGGAALVPEDFIQICAAAAGSSLQA